MKKGHRRAISAPNVPLTSFDDDEEAEALKVTQLEVLQSLSLESSRLRLGGRGDPSENASTTESPLSIRTSASLDASSPAKWAITFDQLLEVDSAARKFYGNVRYKSKTMRDINRDIIIPVCRESGQSYSLFKNPNGQMIDAFITHCWDEPFQDFVSSIRSAFSQDTKKPKLWICAFALKQGDERAMAADLDRPLEEVPFVRALRAASWFVVVRNSKRDLYSRIWCVCELMFAIEEGFSTSERESTALDLETNRKNPTKVIGPNIFSNSRSSCMEAKASDPNDKDKILSLLKTKHTVQDIDDIVNRYRKWPGDAKNFTVAAVATNLSFLLMVMAVIVWLIVRLSKGPSDSPSPAPTLACKNFMECLPNVTSLAIKDQSSPQHKALSWFNGSNIAAKHFFRQKQLFVLATIYHSYSGENWLVERNWMRHRVLECSWDGVFCNDAGQVAELRLDAPVGTETEDGRLPPELSLLDSLENLTISRVKIHIPLQTLLPSQSLLEFSNLKNLRLSDNSISGALVPESFGGLQQLTTFNLNGNSLAGSLPSEIGLLSMLEGLYLDHNYITAVPTEIGNLVSLKALYIKGNELTSALPDALCSIQSLRIIEVECSFCPGPCAALCRGCQNTTSAPTASPYVVTVQGSVTYAPTAVAFPDNLPTYPEFSVQSAALSWLLHEDPLYKRLDNWQKEQRFAMTTFFYAYNGTNWFGDGAGDWLSKESECDWGTDGSERPKCNADDRVVLLELSDQDTNVTGSSPAEMTLLPFLETFEMRNLKLHTDLDEVLPVELASLDRLARITLENSHIVGSLPTYLGSFWQISHLSLKGNELSGSVPSELGQMSALVQLQLQENDLTGVLPVGICLLPNLQSLSVDCRKIDCPIECNCDCQDALEETMTTIAPTNASASSPPPVSVLDITPFPTSRPGKYEVNLLEFTVIALDDGFSPQTVAYRWLEDHPGLYDMAPWKKQQLFAVASFICAFSGTEWFLEDPHGWADYSADECLSNDIALPDHPLCDDDGRLLKLSSDSFPAYNGSVVPPEIGMLSSLEAFEVHRSDTFNIQLEDGVPVQLAHVPLKTLSISDTQVNGTLPTRLAMLRGLTSLNLQNNRALTGTLPTELGLLSNLQFMNLYGNPLLSGPIPSELAMISSLESLLVDRTNITGTVPAQLCGMPLFTLRVNCSLVGNCTSCAACSCYNE